MGSLNSAGMPVSQDVNDCSSDAERGRNSRSVSVYLRVGGQAEPAALSMEAPGMVREQGRAAL